MFKILVIFVVFGAVVFAEEHYHMQFFERIQDALQTSANCLQKYNLNAWSLNEMKGANFPNNYDLKCYFKCYFQRLGMMTNEGTFKLNTVKERLSKEQFNVLQHCSDVELADHCENAYKVFKCFVKGLVNMNQGNGPDVYNSFEEDNAL